MDTPPTENSVFQGLKSRGTLLEMDWRRARYSKPTEQAYESARDKWLRTGHVRPAGPARSLSRARIAELYGADKLSAESPRPHKQGYPTQRR